VKVKDLPNFPKEKVDEKGLSDHSLCKLEGYNQARSEIGELEIPERELDVEKVKTLLLSPNLDVAINFDENVAEYLAQAICSNQKELMR